jgi:hypothetical protein
LPCVVFSITILFLVRSFPIYLTAFLLQKPGHLFRLIQLIVITNIISIAELTHPASVAIRNKNREYGLQTATGVAVCNSYSSQVMIAFLRNMLQNDRQTREVDSPEQART